ncbi:MAG: acetylornithine/succinylornithine family transaminase [Ruminococcaceae bacterium]|nr:acetylornithine/succinylornithine family transaminase [Oscillospiraceae bacterium]
MNIFEKDNSFVASTYARFPLNLVSGKGSVVYDDSGKGYIDMATGIAVNTFGVADEEWVKAVTNQLNTLQHASNLYYTKPCADLAEILCNRTGLKKVFFGNSGAEANECAIKVARKYAADKKGSDYNTIITLKNSFHGRTITTLAATGQDVFHNDFLPLTDGFVYAEANNIADLEAKVKENKVAAIMFECVQGEGGVLPLEPDFVKAIFEIAEKEDILTIADEVQTGNGRTGALYAFMNYGVLPDIVSTAKGLGNGLPLGATMLGEKVKNVLTPGTHGSTFGGNPVACAGAISVINRIDDELLIEVKEKSEYIFNTLKNAKGVKGVSGMGLMIGIETEKDASEVIKYCMENGVLPIKAKTKVRLLPALNIGWDDLKKAVEIIKKGCEA